MQDKNGNFYGTTSEGGATYQGLKYGLPTGLGTVFKMTPDGKLTTLFSFNMTNGYNPVVGLVEGKDGNFYGITTFGGNREHYPFGDMLLNSGTVFKVTPNGNQTLLYSFYPEGANGVKPMGRIIQSETGDFYGITTEGSRTVFKITTKGVVTFLSPVAYTEDFPELCFLGKDGNFYGIMERGGAFGNGAIIKMTTTGTITTLFSFNGTNGTVVTSLIQSHDGNLYGTTGIDGPGGAIFKMNTKGELIAFYPISPLINTSGAAPTKLLQGINGNFYGIIPAGHGGTIFTMNKNGEFTALCSIDGGAPHSLMQAEDGNLYGTTTFGGAYNLGTIFRVSLSTTK